MQKRLNLGLLILALAVPLCVGGLSAMITGDMMKEYHFLNKPALSPPGWLFPIVWTLLYIMMGLASYLVISSGADKRIITNALIFFALQLALNFLWSILFFNNGLFLRAFVELIVMWIAAIITTVIFFKINRAAGWMMIPYILWTTFAGYLNFAVYKLSITPMPLPR